MKMVGLTKILFGLAKANKRIFTAREISILTGETRSSIGMTLLRAQKEGLVARVKSIWINMIDKPNLEELALSLKTLSYISFESALYKHGILSQSPRGELTVATLQRSESITTPLGTIRYCHIPKKLFFGFSPTRIATPEKAYLDYIYMNIRKGRKNISETLYPDELDRKILLKSVKRFPAYVASFIKVPGA